MAIDQETKSARPRAVDFDLHGLVGVRLIEPAASDVTAVSRQLGPLARPLDREPDIVIRFVDHLPLPELTLLGLNHAGFTASHFYLLRAGKRTAKVQIAFEQIGGRCELLCESGLRAVPLLIHIVNMTMLKKGCLPLHASAFTFQGHGIVVTGWAKGGKSEALLAFTRHGARYLGDEWVYLTQDGTSMYGIPENMRLWDWHLRLLPAAQRQVKRSDRLLFRTIHALDAVQQRIPQKGIGALAPVKLLRSAMPALKRQLNVQLPPEKIFNGSFGPLHGTPDLFFFMLSHTAPKTTVSPVSPQEVANRMIASQRCEQLPLLEHYLEYTFAFPDRRNPFLETVHERQHELLRQILQKKKCYAVRHPYPVPFEALYEKMLPFCGGVLPQTPDGKAENARRRVGTAPGGP